VHRANYRSAAARLIRFAIDMMTSSLEALHWEIPIAAFLFLVKNYKIYKD